MTSVRCVKAAEQTEQGGILCFGFARARCTGCGHGFLADRPTAVTVLTRIFLEEIERLLGADLAALTECVRTRLVRWF
jgi:hypothetical protein